MGTKYFNVQSAEQLLISHWLLGQGLRSQSIYKALNVHPLAFSNDDCELILTS